MPSEVFLRADMRYLSRGLADNTGHSGISNFEMSLGLQTTGNKGDRAVQVVRHIFEQPETDLHIVELLNFLYVENAYADQATYTDAYFQLRDNVLEPRGLELTSRGFTLPDGRDIDDLRAGAQASTQAIEVTSSSAPSSRAPSPPAAPAAQQTEVPVTSIIRDASKVFVVHGRDTRPVNVLKQYLSHLGLHMMPWYEAVGLTGESQPHTYDIVKAGMDGAAAIIVVFSPDDLARVKDEYSSDGDPHRALQGQARQNVILEAGMAFALERRRTIFLRSAHTRDISDISGFNWVTLDGEWESRRDLKGRLTQAGAAVRPGDYNLADSTAGPFRVA